jgi:uncharacterized protein YkwD
MRIRLLAAVLVAILVVLAIAPAAGAATSNVQTYRWQLIFAINKTRHAHGLAPVYHAPGLDKTAQGHSADMIARHYFAHTSPTGSTLFDRISRSGFTRYGAWWAGETLAWGTGSYAQAQHVIAMWLASPPHRAILLSSRFSWVGVGRAVGPFEGNSSAAVWTADWGHR